jgi:iron-sulfur cluster assembly protein
MRSTSYTRSEEETHMLTLTGNAVSAIREITSRPGLSDDTGLRIASSAASDGGATFEIAVTATPAPSDAVIEEEGARVFLDPDASVALDDKALDVEVDEGMIRFRIEEQQP